MLAWTSAALGELGRGTPGAQANAIKRMAPTLRSLRHSDGALARFHGGGRGVEGRLDQAWRKAGSSRITRRVWRWDMRGFMRPGPA